MFCFAISFNVLQHWNWFWCLIGPFCCIDHTKLHRDRSASYVQPKRTANARSYLSLTGERTNARGVRHPTLMSGVYVGTHRWS
ncbi:MAG: hypothetical protein ACTS6G_01945 [Candidatus Hodgkinia cicadicola]